MPGLVPSAVRFSYETGSVPGSRDRLRSPLDATDPVRSDSGDNVGRREQPPALSPLSSCPDLFRASTSLRRLVRRRPAPRCRKTWMPGTSPLLSGLDFVDRVQGLVRGRDIGASVGSGHGLRHTRTCWPTGWRASPCPPLSPRTCSGVQSRRASRSGGRARISGSFWTPEQVRGDNDGTETFSPMGAAPASKT